MQKLIKEMIGYKIFNTDLTCRGFQFETDKINDLGNDAPLELCQNGFHFCKYPSGVWSYYSTGRVFKIKAYDVLDFEETPGVDLKLVCRKIELMEELKPDGNYNTGDCNTGDCNTGYYNTGNRNTGNYNTGNCNTGDYNTGYYNTGNRNTGNYNTGNCNTGDYNTGDCNTGDCNTGNRNTGNRNTGYCNTGNYNTGNHNTGNHNTGDCNTGNHNSGNYNTGNSWLGSLNLGEAPFYLFNKIADRKLVDFNLVRRLYNSLIKPEAIDPTPFLSLPNATKKKIKALHDATLKARGLK